MDHAVLRGRQSADSPFLRSIDPVHFGMIMLLNLGIGLCHPPVGAILFVGCAVGKVTLEDVMRKIWPFYGVMFFVLMLVTYLPEISLWLPRHVLR
jgi:TRAP-type C4-dicarboxylate transport system permease large subunit